MPIDAWARRPIESAITDVVVAPIMLAVASRSRARAKLNAIVRVTLAEKITRVATLKIEMPHSLTGWRK